MTNDMIDLREFDIRFSTFLYFISSILSIALSSSSPSFFLHWIATSLLVCHVYRLSWIKVPWIAFWRIYALFIYGIITSAILSVNITVHNNQVTGNSSGSIAIGVVGILISAVTGVILVFLPLPNLPPLRGRYTNIGTTTFHVEKSRDMVIQCWYPLPNKELSKSNWWRNELSAIWDKKAIMWTTGHPLYELAEAMKLFEALSLLNGIPLVAFRHMCLAQSHSRWSDEIDLSLHPAEMYPVAIYSHGLYGWRQIHHTACEQLASNGFVVFAIDHTPDATISRPHKDPSKSAHFDFEGPDDDGSYGPEYRGFYERGIQRRFNDIIELMDYLGGDAAYAHRLDVNRVFIWGHSYGGGTAAMVAALDSRIAGVMLHDSWMFPVPDDVRKLGTSAPVLCVSSELWEPCKYQSAFRNDFLNNSRNPYPRYNLIFRGTDHQNYCDVVHLTSRYLLTRPSSIGPNVNPNQVGDALDRLMVSFFLAIAHSKTFVSLLAAKQSSASSTTILPPDVKTSSPSQQPCPSPDAKQLLGLLVMVKEEVMAKIGCSKEYMNEELVCYLEKNLLDALSTPHCFDVKFLQALSNNVPAATINIDIEV